MGLTNSDPRIFQSHKSQKREAIAFFHSVRNKPDDNTMLYYHVNCQRTWIGNDMYRRENEPQTGVVRWKAGKKKRGDSTPVRSLQLLLVLLYG